MLYLGAEPLPHAADAVAAARAAGMRAAFVTNNASRRAAAVADHLTALDIPAEPDDVVTSAQAAVGWLTRNVAPGAAVLVLGSAGLLEEVAEGGFVPVRTADGIGGRGGVAAVVQGLEPATSWSDLAEAAVALGAGALWVAGNTDATYPSPRGLLPGNGAMVQALVHTTGRRPVVVGKPEPELHRASVERVGAQRPLVVGDRLDTDVLGAVRAGADSLLVLTGVTDRAVLLAAPEGMRPTYVSQDLRGLLRAHPAAVVERGEARCGEARAWWEVDQVSGDPVPGERRPEDVRSSGPEDDALRAACALAWSR